MVWVIIHEHVATHVIARAVCPMRFERVDQYRHLLTVAWRVPGFSVVTWQGILSGQGFDAFKDLWVNDRFRKGKLG
jgi:hypothetical protein